MAFSLLSFLGGAAGAGSQILDERRDQKRRDDVTAEQRQWQIATEARQANANRKSQRDADKRQLDDLMEEAALHFNEDQMKYLGGQGKAGLSLAITRAKELSPYGIKGADILKLPSINSGKDMPTGADLSKSMRLTDLLAPVPTASKMYTGNSFEGLAIHAMENLRVATTEEEKTMWENQLVEANNLLAGKNNKNEFKDTAIKTAVQTTDAIVNNALLDANLAQMSLDKQMVVRREGNQADVFNTIGRAYTNILSNPAMESNSVLKDFVTKKQIELSSDIINFKNTSESNYNKFINASEQLKNMSNKDEGYEELTDTVNALRPASDRYEPFNPAEPLTLEQVKDPSKYMKYSPNTTIQVLDESTGTYKHIIRTSNGILVVHA